MEYDPERVEAFLKEHPEVVPIALAALGLLLMQRDLEKPWAKDLPQFEKHAGPWRGKGSFGSGPFGPQ